MDIIIHSIESVVGISLMVALGLVLARRGYFDEKGSTLIAWLVIKVSMPCMALVNITDNFTRDTLHNLFYDMALPLAVTVVCYAAGCLFCHLLKVPRGRREIFKTTFYITNCLFIGLPINIELFGPESAVYVFEYYIVNTVALWTVGVYEIAAEGSGGKAFFDFRATVKSIILSPLLGIFIAIALILAGLSLPGVLKTPLKYMGGMTTPLSMLFIGIALSRVKLFELTVTREMTVAYLGRFLVGPLSLFLLHQIIPANELLFKVTLIQSAMPVAAAIPTLAAAYGLDIKYSAILASMSTLMFIAVIPAYMWLMHIYFAG